MTQAVARYMPSISRPSATRADRWRRPVLEHRVDRVRAAASASIADGTLAPAMVSQKTERQQQQHERESPTTRLVTRRSMVRSRSKRGRSIRPRDGPVGDAGGLGVDRLHQLWWKSGPTSNAALGLRQNAPPSTVMLGASLSAGRPPAARSYVAVRPALGGAAAIRSPSSPLRTASTMRSSPSSRRRATHRRWAGPG